MVFLNLLQYIQLGVLNISKSHKMLWFAVQDIPIQQGTMSV